MNYNFLKGAESSGLWLACLPIGPSSDAKPIDGGESVRIKPRPI